MAFHRLTVPSYLGGLPAGFDYINNAISGTPAPADGAKVGGTNAGTYFDAFGEDATSSNANRSNKALAQNCDFLDDVVSTPTPILERATMVLAAPANNYVLTGTDVFVGKLGTTNNQTERDKLVCIVDADGNEVIDSAGIRAMVTAIDDGAGPPNNLVGMMGAGFYTGPTIRFNVTLPAGTYGLFYGRKSRLSDITSTTVDIGAMLAYDVFAAHRVPWESMRFMAEVSRQSGGFVQALVCSVLETPIDGSIPGWSTELTVDVDQEGKSIPLSNAIFNVRFMRDVTLPLGEPKTLFSVRTLKDVLLGDDEPASWLCPDDVARLGDVNTIHGFTSHASKQFSIPLSGAQADGQGDYLLRLGGGLHGTASQPTILKALNCREITVGNGTTTFGDFNGSSALYDAIMFAKALSPNPGAFKIIVKPGTYIFTSAISLTSGAWIFEGTGFAECILENRLSGTTSMFTTNDLNLEFRDLQFKQYTGSSPVAFTMNGATPIFKRCYFSQQKPILQNIGGTPFYECAFYGPASHPCVEVQVQYGTSRLFFYNCWFQARTSSPVLRVVSTASSSATFQGAFFKDCQIQLSSTTVSGGNPVGNPGVLEVQPNGNNNLIIDEIQFNNCRVFANSGGSGTNNIFMYLRTFDGSNIFIVKRIKILGGCWTCPATDSDLTAFYVGGGAYTDSSLVQDFILEDVDWGPTGGGDYGVGSSECGASSISFAGTFIKVYRSIRIHGMRFGKGSINTQSGELWLAGAVVYDVDGIFLQDMEEGPAISPPEHRMVFEGNNSAGSIKNVSILADFWGHPAVTTLGRYIKLTPYGRLVVENIHIIGESSYVRHGFGFGAASAASTLKGLDMRNCRAKGCQMGAYFTAAYDIENLTIRDCSFSENWQGFQLSTSSGSGKGFLNLVFHGNEAIGNTNLGGIISPDVWTSSTYLQSLNMCNNSIYNNNGGVTNVQLQFGALGKADDGIPHGVFMNNNFGNDTGSDTEGKVKLYNTTSPVTTYPLCRGLETHLEDPTSGGTWPLGINDKSCYNGNRMLFNQGSIATGT